MKTLIFTLILSVIFFSCQDESDTGENTAKEIELSINSEPPEIDQSTPDLAVKSFMKYIKWFNITSLKTEREYVSQVQQFIDRFYNNEYHDTLRNNLKYLKTKADEIEKANRTITDVKMMTDTRAVVMQQTDEKTSGYDGEKATIYERFTLGKENDKWLIEKCECTCNFCDGTGKVREYGHYFKEVYKDCELCGGSGWRVMWAMGFY